MPPRVHASVPLSLSKAIRDNDAADVRIEGRREPADGEIGSTDGIDEQIARYSDALARGLGVWFAEASGLATVVGKRPDASRLFSDAGRMLGDEAVQSISSFKRTAIRKAPASLKRALSFRELRRIVTRYFGGTLTTSAGQMTMSIPVSATVNSAPGSLGCTFYATALSELLHVLVNQDVAVRHTQCQQRGDQSCVWKTEQKALLSRS